MNERGIKVLLVEDEQLFADLHRTMLAGGYAHRFEICHVKSFSDAREWLRQRSFDVILLDLTLPDSDGLTTYLHMKSAAPATPIIVLSGVTDENIALQAMRDGAQDYLVKGEVDGRILTRVIRYAIERMRAQEALRQSEEFFRLIAENVQDLIAVIDRDGRRLYNSPSYAKLLGNPERMRGTDSFAEIYPEDRERVRSIFLETLATGLGKDTDYRMLCKDGSLRFIESRGSVIRDPNGQPCKVVVVSRDITDHKESVQVLREALADLKKSHEELSETQMQLVQAERLEAVSTFAAGVAHEVKNPLQAILLGLDFLSAHVVNGNETARFVLEEMNNAVQRADGIIRSLMEFATYRNRQALEQDLNSIIEAALPSVSKELVDSRIRLMKGLGEELPPVLLDARTMKHVFINLFLNAIQDMPEGGVLSVRTFAQLAGVAFPNGTMLPPQFKPEDIVLTTEIEEIPDSPCEWMSCEASGIPAPSANRSSGLGLTVLKKIIELHGGTISIPSRRPGDQTITIHFRANVNSSL